MELGIELLISQQYRPGNNQKYTFHITASYMVALPVPSNWKYCVVNNSSLISEDYFWRPVDGMQLYGRHGQIATGKRISRLNNYTQQNIPGRVHNWHGYSAINTAGNSWK